MNRLGPFLCWAVVFADIGTSIYYVPGILYQQVGVHAALFVGMSLLVFLMLTLKYAEVAVRYPEGGGVVTVATHAIHPFAGLVGGLLILVDYFLTAALSALSGIIYLSVVMPQITPWILPITVVSLVVLGALNLIGISESAKVSALFAVVAFISQMAVVVATFLYIGPAHIAGTFSAAITSGPRLLPIGLLTGYAGAFLAFSGLESIAQLAPAMQLPRRRVSRQAMLIVAVTILLTSPLLTLWSTTLLNASKDDPNQFISLLGGFSAGQFLQVEVAVTGALLLIFASNTAIIGSYHVFLALARMHFLPQFLTHRNKLRDTPHWAILVSVVVPVAVLVAVLGDVGTLGDLYAFGLLGAFTLTCLSLDIVRWQERKITSHTRISRGELLEVRERVGGETRLGSPTGSFSDRLMFGLGVLTTVAVTVAWCTNLVAKPYATAFGGGVTVLGLVVAGVTYQRQTQQGRPFVMPRTYRPGYPLVFMNLFRQPSYAPVLAVIPEDGRQVDALTRAAYEAAEGAPVYFLYHGRHSHGYSSSRPGATPLFRIVHPYLEDENAQAALTQVAAATRTHRNQNQFIYAPPDETPHTMHDIWETIRPRDTVLVSSEADEARDLDVDKLHAEKVDGVPILHFEKKWREVLPAKDVRWRH